MCDAQRCCGVQINTGAPRHVVENDGEGRRGGHVAEVLVEPFLAWLVVERADDEHAIDARQVGRLKEADDAGRVVASATQEDGHAPMHPRRHLSRDFFFFGRVQARRFGRSAQNAKEIGAMSDLIVYNGVQSRVVDSPVGRKWGGNGHAQPLKYIFSLHSRSVCFYACKDSANERKERGKTNVFHKHFPECRLIL